MNFIKPAKAIPLLPKNKIKKIYKYWRLRIFLVAYISYFTYYFGRSSFDISKQYIKNLTPDYLGIIGASLGISYGISKFLMGNISDRSNAKIFLSIGLLGSGIINLLIPKLLSTNIFIIFLAMFINGWFQGMGWPACARIITHWFSINERGTRMGIWNTAHNVGAGFLAIAIVPVGLLIFHNNWQGIFYIAGIICILISILILKYGADTPQSLGLPPIEIYKGYLDLKNYYEKEFSAKEIFFKYVLNNQLIWIIAIANAFIYCARYGLLSWLTYYLINIKHMSTSTGILGFALFELPAIPGTIIIGWITDTYFNNRRVPIAIISMILFICNLIIYWYTNIIFILLITLSAMGIFIYGPIALIGIISLDIVPKKAGGTAAGFVGLLGYFLGTCGAQLIIGIIATVLNWNAVFIFLLISSLLATILLSICWKH